MFPVGRSQRLGREEAEAGEREGRVHRGYFAQRFTENRGKRSSDKKRLPTHAPDNVSEAVGRATRGMDRETRGFTSALAIEWHL